MLRKVLLSACLLLFFSGIWVLVMILKLPAFPHELLLNEQTYYVRLNSINANIILSDAYEVIDENKRSSNPRTIKAIEELLKTSELLSRSDYHLELASQLRGNADSVAANLKMVTKSLEQASEVSSIGHDYKWWKNTSNTEIDALPPSMSALQLEIHRYEVQTYYALLADKLMQDVGAGAIRFDMFKGMERNTSPSWIKGQIAFHTPTTMRLNQKERVHVRISKRFLSDMLESMPEKEFSLVDTVLVGDIMLVKLLGDDFKISSFDDEEQGVTDDAYTQWEFEVTPLKSGVRDLYLKVGMVYNVPGLGNTKKYLPVYEKQISVEVNVWQQIAGFSLRNWQFIAGTIIIPLGLWLISQFRQRRKRKRNTFVRPRVRKKIP